jgi:zinc transporter ZupT
MMRPGHSGKTLGYNDGVVSYRTGILVGAVLGGVTFVAWLVGYLVWDGLQWGDLVKSVIAAAVFMISWLVLLARLNRQRG